MTDNVAKTLLENRSEHHIYHITLDNERTSEVTCDGFEYDPMEGSGKGYLRLTIEFSDLPDLGLEPDRFSTKLGKVSVVEMEDGWGTPILSAAVQHVEDGELVEWEYPTIGTIASVEQVDDGE